MYEEKSTLKRLKLLSNLFRKQDAEKISPHTGMFLTRTLKKDLIHRINRGNYINAFLYGFPGKEEIGCFLRPPAYVTCEWASPKLRPILWKSCNISLYCWVDLSDYW